MSVKLLPCHTLLHSPTAASAFRIPTKIGDRKRSGPTLRGSIVMTMPFGLLKRASGNSTALSSDQSYNGAGAFSRLPSTWPGRPRAPAYS